MIKKKSEPMVKIIVSHVVEQLYAHKRSMDGHRHFVVYNATL
jgi:hypothetical protein